MRKTALIALGVVALASSGFAGGWRYSGFDANGNYLWGNVNNNGSYSGFDGNGNYQWGHINRNGSYSGFDGQGNYYWGRFSPY